MTTIYFMRHGEVYNPKMVLYGRLPRFPLSEAGKNSISEAANFFRTKNISHIYSSPMLRTKQTAQIIKNVINIPVTISSRLIEVKIFCQGIPLPVYREKIQERLYSKENLRNGQESLDSIYSRMMKFVQEVLEKHPNQSILTITHGDPILILKAGTMHRPFTWEYKRKHYTPTGKWIRLQVKDNLFIWEESF